MSNIILHSYWRSSCSWRVRIALAHKKIKYQYKAVHLLNDGGEQFKPDYVKLNPSKEVPTLEIDGHAICQSVAILEYLEETRPENPLLPTNPIEKAKVRQLVNIVASDTQPVQNLRVLLYAMSKGADKLEWGKHWITKGFEAFEQVVASTAGQYCVGDQVTLADVALVPQVYNANRFGVDMSQFPTINRIHAALEELDAFKAAHPDVQPDAPSDN
mmetsp:Transcript_20343/g.34715  ORF Transcript_20343/g.34715 Transcript_20343/m.34715 type:complete len:215 (+) Transcript_20343:49-693(+)